MPRSFALTPKYEPNKKPHINVDIPPIKTILTRLSSPLGGLRNASIKPAPSVKSKPYPASESIIPNIRKKKNATPALGSISL